MVAAEHGRTAVVEFLLDRGANPATRDREGNTATIGTKTVVISNNSATKPFGSIDTPGIGGDASGPNFGWGLTPKVGGAANVSAQHVSSGT